MIGKLQKRGHSELMENTHERNVRLRQEKSAFQLPRKRDAALTMDDLESDVMHKKGRSDTISKPHTPSVFERVLCTIAKLEAEKNKPITSLKTQTSTQFSVPSAPQADVPKKPGLRPPSAGLSGNTDYKSIWTRQKNATKPTENTNDSVYPKQTVNILRKVLNIHYRHDIKKKNKKKKIRRKKNYSLYFCFLLFQSIN